MRLTDFVAIVRLVDYSPIVHAVTEKGDHSGEYVTFCGRDTESYVFGDGYVKDVTCRVCQRALGTPTDG